MGMLSVEPHLAQAIAIELRVNVNAALALVRVDPVRHIASEGTVSVIDLQENRVVRELLAGLHTSALALSPNQRWLAAANSASDTSRM